MATDDVSRSMIPRSWRRPSARRVSLPVAIAAIGICGAVLLALCAPASATVRISVRSHPLRLHGAIIGGSPASQGILPFMAFIVDSVSSSSSELCSGTVVSSNVVLTAGHCAVDVSTGMTDAPGNFTVVVGAADWTDTTHRQLSKVTSVIPYPLFDPATASDDAALLVLSSPVSAPPIALPTNADTYLEEAGTAATIAGWGETYSGSAPSYVLQWAPTVVQDPSYCSQYPSNLAYSPATNLCAVNPPSYDTGTCSGDSGGPLFATDYTGQAVELGLTSYGLNNCSTAEPSFFTAVLPLTSWIEQEIRAVAPPPPAPPPPPSPPAPAPAQPRLASLSLAGARQDVRQTLTAVFHRAFRHGHAYKAHCKQLSPTRARCAVSFWYGPNDYYGQVTISNVPGPNNSTEWSDYYIVHWVNNACYNSSHWRRCRIHTRRGSW